MYSSTCSFTLAYAALTLLHKKITSHAPEHAIANPTTRITTLLTHASKRMLLFNQSISRARSNSCALKPRQEMVCEGSAIGWDSDASVSVRLCSALSLLPLMLNNQRLPRLKRPWSIVTSLPCHAAVLKDSSRIRVLPASLFPLPYTTCISLSLSPCLANHPPNLP